MGWRSQLSLTQVVQAIVAEDAGAGLEPHSGLAKVGGAVVLQQLGGQAAQGAEHSLQVAKGKRGCADEPHRLRLRWGQWAAWRIST